MARRRGSKLKFSGDLAKPLAFSPPTFTVTKFPVPPGPRSELSFVIQAQLAIYDQVAARVSCVDDRLDLLCELFGISQSDPRRFRTLAICLASECVPGFMHFEKAGAPLLWDALALGALRQDVDKLVAEGHSVMGACRILIKAPEGRFSTIS